jgi:hypothetical protein
MTDALGRLERVDLRNIWLSEALGMELELEAVEQSVGPFRADILCKDTSTGAWVLLENQLERTDHTHLGQLITYAAGLDAVTIIWIAATVADEHRAAMDWLNEITAQDVRFFALEVELWQIGDSPAAPKFNLVSQPNDWSRSTAAGRKAVADTPLTPVRELQLAYWTEVEQMLGHRSNRLKPVKPQSQSWLSHGIGRTGFALNVAMNTRAKFIRVEVYLSGTDAKTHFDMLAAQRGEIETALGSPLDWQRLEDGKDARICRTLLDVDPAQRNDWARQHGWLVDTMISFHEVFAPRIRNLQA